MNQMASKICTGHGRYTALLDACVLFPIAVADSLMSLATAGLFAAKWTQRIELEWITNLEELRPTLKLHRPYTEQIGLRARNLTKNDCTEVRKFIQNT